MGRHWQNRGDPERFYQKDDRFKKNTKQALSREMYRSYYILGGRSCNSAEIDKFLIFHHATPDAATLGEPVPSVKHLSNPAPSPSPTAEIDQSVKLTSVGSASRPHLVGTVGKIKKTHRAPQEFSGHCTIQCSKQSVLS